MENASQRACQDIMNLLDYAKHAIVELAEAQGLTRTQLYMLHTLDQKGEIAMREAADVLHCDASNITGIVDRMVAIGLLERQARPGDRRTKVIHLTAKGRTAVEKIHEALPDKLNCKALSAAQCTALHEVTQKVCGC